MTAATDAVAQATTPLPQRHTPCLSRLAARRPWVGTQAVRAGAWHLGIRVNSPRTAKMVDELFAAARLPHLDDNVLPNLSVEITDPSASGSVGRGLHLIYRDHEVVARRRAAEELLLDLAEIVDAVTFADTSDVLAVRAAALVDSDRAVLLPVHVRSALVPLQSSLERSGVALRPTEIHLIDSRSAELVVRPSDHGPDNRARRTPLAVWVLRTLEEEQRPLRSAEAVQLAFGETANLQAYGARSTLEALASLTASVMFWRARLHTDGRLPSELADLFERD